jgi:hypothetical protein
MHSAVPCLYSLSETTLLQVYDFVHGTLKASGIHTDLL